MYFIAALPLNIPIAAHFYAGKNGLMVERLEARCEVAVALPRRSRRMRCIYSDMASSNRSSPALRLVAQIHRSPAFLQTREWARVRYAALRTNDGCRFKLLRSRQV